MDPELWETLENLFLEACRLPRDRQAQFVEASTEGNHDLRRELGRMLKAHQRPSVLDSGIEGVLGDALLEPESLSVERIGAYRPLKRLGSGGMGIVFLASREDWDTQVAIKMPRDIWIAPDQIERFQSEQRLLAQLTHPGIARIYEGGRRASGTPWFAMEYVDGEPITEYCRKREVATIGRLRLFLAVCEATQYAHSRLIIHRDLKPSNIFVTPEGKVKLLDFGIAKQLSAGAPVSTLTKNGFQPVTLAYAAPEQILRNEVSIGTDIYTLGVVLYELLTNQLPFELAGLNAVQAGEMIRDAEHMRPSAAETRQRDVPVGLWKDLDVLILKAMHKDAGQRYRTVDALIRDIHHFLADEPLDARPDGTAYRLSKFLRRNQKNVAFAGAAATVILVLSICFFLWLTKARNAALAEVARTRRVTTLLQTMLSGGDADNGPSKDMKVVEMLDLARKKAELLNADPIQQAEIYTTLGTLYTNLGDYAKADTILHAACSILATHAPVSHEMGEALLELGVLYSAQSNDERSLLCMRKALAVEQQITAPDKTLLYRTRTGIAYALLDSNPRAAVAILEDLLKEPPGSASEEALSDVWNNLATGYNNMGEYAKAEPYVRMVLAYSQKTRPAIHPDISAELIDLSVIERELKRYTNAEGDLRRALAIDLAWYPRGHEETADVKRMLANVLFLEKRYEEAMVLAKEALAEEEKTLGPWNRRTAYAMQIMGELDLKRGDPAEATSLFQQEVASLSILKDQTNLPRALTFLGDAYMAQRRYKQGEEAYRKAVALYDSSLVPAKDLQAEANRKLGNALMLQGSIH